MNLRTDLSAISPVKYKNSKKSKDESNYRSSWQERIGTSAKLGVTVAAGATLSAKYSSADQVTAVESFDDILLKIQDKDSKLNDIDFRNTTLTLTQLKALEVAISQNDFIGHVNWPTYFYSDKGEPTIHLNTQMQVFVNRIEQKVVANNKTFRLYPNDFVMVLLSDHVYDHGKKGIKKGERLEFVDPVHNEVTKDWVAFEDGYHDKDSGYHGASYINHKTRQIVLAHRGTVDPKDFRTDLESVLLGKIKGQQEYSSERAKELVQWAKLNGYTFSTTGHSLGSWHAELCLYDCYYNYNYPIAKAVGFDSPGARRMMEVYRPHILGPENARKLKELHIVTYLSKPNIVNVCGERVGRVYTVYPYEVKASEWSSFLPGKIVDALTAKESAQWHPLSNIISRFDSKTCYPIEYWQMEDWPCLHYKYEDSAHGEYLASEVSHVISDWVTDRLSMKELVRLYQAKSEFYLSHAHHFKPSASSVHETNRATLVTSRKDDLDWCIKKFYENAELICSQSNISPLMKIQLKAILDSFRIDRVQGKYHMVSKPGEDIEIIRQRFFRLISINDDQLRKLLEINVKKSDKVAAAPVVMAPTTTAPTERIILPVDLQIPRNPRTFIARNAELTQIEGVLREKQLVVISAYGGTGKTSCAIDYSYKQHEKGKIVRWFRAENNFNEEFKRLAIDLGISAEQKPEVLRGEVTKKLKAMKEEMIFVFDNAEKYDELAPYIKDLPENVKIMITTRNKKLISSVDSKDIDHGHIVLEPFNEAQAKTYIERVLRDKEIVPTPDEINKLVKLFSVDGKILPLRLNQAVSTLVDNDIMAIDDYIAQYKQQEEQATQVTDSTEANSPESAIILGRLFNEKASIEDKQANKLGWQIRYC